MFSLDPPGFRTQARVRAVGTALTLALRPGACYQFQVSPALKTVPAGAVIGAA